MTRRRARPLSRRPRCGLTAAEIAESDRLRDVIARLGLDYADVAAAAGAPVCIITLWMGGVAHLAVCQQVGIRSRWTAETGGPG